jgi:sortase A
MVSRSLSWLLVVGGLGLAGYGVYDYYSGVIAQREAENQWEDPIPQALPVPDKKGAANVKPLRYFDPYRPGDTVAKLTLPRLDTTLFVVEGTDQKELKKGPGHMPGTALPGVDGNCVIAGHRDTHFRVLEGIREGDKIELETKYGRFQYQVRSMTVVTPTNVSSLYPTNEAVLHLITCYPFNYVGHAPKRMVIEASLDRQGNETASR